ncbi:MAG: PQQ-binding-like beta-propeller repeat protein [Gemmataceae bacterium]
MPRFILIVGGLIVLMGADWPQFLGPTRDSAAPEKIAPWTQAPQVVWKQPVGDAHASPVLAGGVVYAFYQPKKQNADALAAFDAGTGAKLWEKSYEREAFTPPFGKGPRGTPAIADGTVFTFGSTGILAAWDAKTGDVRWKVDTLKQFGAANLFFGINTSPIVVKNRVIVMVGGKGAGVVAFDTQTGDVAWKALDDAASYSSPILRTGTGNTPELVFLTGANLVGLGLDGTPRWTFPFKDKLNESSTTPVLVGTQLLGSSVTAGSVFLDLSSPEPAKLWARKPLTCYFSTPVVAAGHIFMVNGAATLTNPAVNLRCVNPKTGDVSWTKSNVGGYHAALVKLADEKLLLLDDRGELCLIAADTTEYKELARSKVCGATWAHPAVVDGRVYLRDNENLICLKP